MYLPKDKLDKLMYLPKDKPDNLMYLPKQNLIRFNIPSFSTLHEKVLIRSFFWFTIFPYLD